MTPSDLKRFEAKVSRVESGCWIWRGASNPKGYGQIWIEGRLQYAHRAIFAHRHGPIPKGADVCHRCDTPACVNPAHLFVGTRSDNMRDMSRKGRASMRLAKLTPDAVRWIRARAAAGERMREIARSLGVSPHTVGRVLHGQTFTHVR